MEACTCKRCTYCIIGTDEWMRANRRPEPNWDAISAKRPSITAEAWARQIIEAETRSLK